MKLLIPLAVLLLFIDCDNNSNLSLIEQSSKSKNKFEATNDHAVNRQPEIDSIKYNLAWLDSFKVENTLINRVEVPVGFKRFRKKEGSFPHWIRRLPLKEGNPKVMLYNGEEKWNQEANAFVFDLDVGDRDLQQCADAVMRIRAEYLFHTQQYNKIHFNYTNGALVQYSKWRNGNYPIPKGKSVYWVRKEKCNESYKSFKTYMVQIFNYAGTHSLSKELTSIKYNDMQIGDILIYGGFPGHTVMVVDLVVNEQTKEKKFLLAQSYMPAQDFHILKKPSSDSPWYDLNKESIIDTPEWSFDSSQLMRWN